MKLTSFSTWLNESINDEYQAKYSKHALAKRALINRGLAPDIMSEIEEGLKKRFRTVKRYTQDNGHETISVEVVLWEKDTWHYDYRKQGKTRPNHYYFSITDWAAEPGTVRVIWHSFKHYNQEIVFSGDTVDLVRSIVSTISKATQGVQIDFNTDPNIYTINGKDAEGNEISR
jgi:hypothetical protein